MYHKVHFHNDLLPYNHHNYKTKYKFLKEKQKTIQSYSVGQEQYSTPAALNCCQTQCRSCDSGHSAAKQASLDLTTNKNQKKITFEKIKKMNCLQFEHGNNLNCFSKRIFQFFFTKFRIKHECINIFFKKIEKNFQIKIYKTKKWFFHLRRCWSILNIQFQ